MEEDHFDPGCAMKHINRCLATMLAVLSLAPVAARADGPPTTPAGEQTVPPAADEELPYGSGYEARQAQAAAEQEQARVREEAQAQAHERSRSESRSAATEARAARGEPERAASARAVRREARDARGQRGPNGR